MMGKSESGLAEPHAQEHLAILARGLCFWAKAFGSNGDELGTYLFYVRKDSEKSGQPCAQKKDEKHVQKV